MSILSSLSYLPMQPGVYFFKNKDHDIIYIGKAKNIRRRVAHYFQNKSRDWKIAALLDEHASIEYVVTQSEHDALLLEADLIKRHQPKYNVLLTAGDPYVYIKITKESPRTLSIVRIKQGSGDFFGPFMQKKDARRCYDYLMHTFSLQQCSGAIVGGCLRYHLGRCAGNCVPGFTQHDYDQRIELARLFLKQDRDAVIQQLQKQIAEYNQQLAFEKARTVAGYLKNIDTIFSVIANHYRPEQYTSSIEQVALRHIREKSYQDGFDALSNYLGRSIHTIDCFDVSHFQSTALVGSCIRFTDGLPDSSAFRHFTIRTLTRQNDYAALQEIVSRRYKGGNYPDVVLIDGGKGQRNAVYDLVGTAVLLSLAKREERLFGDAFPEGIIIDLQDPLGRLLIAMRDYAHHFAISHHRARRRKAVLS